MRDEAGLAFDEVAPEHLAHVAADALLDQMTREMRAPDHRRIRHVAQRSLEGAFDAGARQLLAHRACALLASAARRGEPLGQCARSRIDPQSDDVYGLDAPAHRDLDAADEGHAQALRLRARLGQSAEVIVVGEREQPHAAGMRAANHFGRGERTVGDAGVTVQVGVDVRQWHARCAAVRQAKNSSISRATSPGRSWWSM